LLAKMPSRVQTSVASGSYFHDAAPPMAPGMAPMGPGAGPMHGTPGGMIDPATGAYIPSPGGIDAGGAPGGWQPRALQGHVIEEDEGPQASAPPPGEFSFPVTAAGQPDSPHAALNSVGSYSGMSNPLSTATGVPSQSLTGILNNANALLGEMGTGSVLTGAQSAAMLSRHSSRNMSGALTGAFTGGYTSGSAAPGPAGTGAFTGGYTGGSAGTGGFTGGYTGGSAGTASLAAPSRGSTPPPLPPPPQPRKRSPSPSPRQ
jgi:hypothetical protein